MNQQRTALVSGSTSGIGLGVAGALATAGYDVMLNGFGDAAEIDAIRIRLAESTGRRIEHDGADLSAPEGCEQLIAAARDAFGGVDVLVNNAGIQHVSPIESFPWDAWSRIIAVNLSAPFVLTKLVVPEMRERGFGRIINTASVHGLVASVHKAAYIAAKHGLVGLTKTVALEVAGAGITCNAICPGFVKTPLVEVQIEARARELGVGIDDATAGLLEEKQPSRQFATPADIGALAVFLCADAAAQITGAALPIDGAWTAQ